MRFYFVIAIWGNGELFMGGGIVFERSNQITAEFQK